MANRFCSSKICDLHLSIEPNRKEKKGNDNTVLTHAVFVDVTEGVLRYFSDSCENLWDWEIWSS